MWAVVCVCVGGIMEGRGDETDEVDETFVYLVEMTSKVPHGWSI